MQENAAVRKSVNSRLARASIALCAAVAILLIPAGPASAGPVTKDGKIHACYRVKGKPKGQLRVVRSAKARCRRGERKVAWSAASASGLPGATAQGSQGGAGEPGASGSDGAADDAALKAQVGALSVRVQALEGLLNGVADGDLSGALSTLQGIDGKGLTNAVNSVPVVGSLEDTLQGLDNEELTDAVETVPAVETLCQQVPGLTEQINGVGAGVVSMIEVLADVPLIGEIFDDVAIPAELPVVGCE
jgi:hypothetical protein